MNQNPLEFYWPHAYGCDGKNCSTNTINCEDSFKHQYTIKGCPQFLFHTSLANVRLFLGSNRVGKTCCGTVEVLFHLTGFYPSWYPKERRYDRAVKGRILASDFKKAVGEVITTSLDEWIPKSLLEAKDKNNQGIYDKYFIKHKSGQISTFDIVTYEQDIGVCEGWAGDFLWYDEPPPQGHRIASARGLIDRNGWEIFTLTPLREAWIYDQLYMRSNLLGGLN